MKTVCVIGAGRIGESISELLLDSGDYQVRLADHSDAQLQRIPTHPSLQTHRTDVGDTAALQTLLDGTDAVINALPWNLTTPVAEAAARSGTAYFDMTEDVAATRAVSALAEGAESAFMPQCGLAPGFVSVVAGALIERFDEPYSAMLRVGALPRYPGNRLGYNLTWSPEGMVNEYCELCPGIVDGELRELAPLTELHEFTLDGVRYESFNTSGGLGTLPYSRGPMLRHLRYQSIRYPGHAHIMRTLLEDLRLRERRDTLLDLLRNALPGTLQDVVVIYVTVIGKRDGTLMEESFVTRVHGGQVNATQRSAIQRVTAGGICAMVDLYLSGRLPRRGLLRQEDVKLEEFLANRFGAVYAGDTQPEARSIAPLRQSA